MKEAYLRKWHRRLGIILALFIFLQTLAALVLNLEDLFEIAAVTGWANVLHRGGGDFGTVYRTLLGLGFWVWPFPAVLFFLKFGSAPEKDRILADSEIKWINLPWLSSKNSNKQSPVCMATD